MPIPWSTEYPTPNFDPNSFGAELQHVKNIYGFLLTDMAYFNPLADDIATMLARIDAVQALLATEMSASLTDYNAFTAYAVGGGANLPQGWIDATNASVSGYTSVDMSAVASTVNTYYQACLLTHNNLQELKDYVTVIDVDNFKLHMELLSGIDDAPPQDILKPNNPSLMGVGMGLIQIEHRFGIGYVQFPFYKADGTLDVSGNLGGGSNLFQFYRADGLLDTITMDAGHLPFYRADGTLDDLETTFEMINHLLGLFGSLFTGDVTIADAQTHLDTDPLSAGTYGPLGISAGVNKPYVSGAVGEDAIWNNSIVGPKVAPLSVPVLLYNAPLITTHKAALTTHIVDDMAYYDECQHKLNSIMKAYGISGHIQDPFFAYMYTDVFGTATLNEIIAQFHAGEIT